MSSSSSQAPLPSGDSEPRNLYSRKEKSLGVLCSNFLNLYNRDGIDSIGLDDAATRLGVERRRIYDIVNILESVGVLMRKAKNQYYWKGFDAIPGALNELKEEGLRENWYSLNFCRATNMVSENHQGVVMKPKIEKESKPSTSSKVGDSRREKSLGLLTQQFVKLFLCSKVDLISLDDAATALLGDLHDPTTMRTKVRRLYDIANVFQSMNLIEKTHHSDSKKPAYRWLGFKGTYSKDEPASASDLKEPKKRAFGTEITNTISKKYKTETSISCHGKKRAFGTEITNTISKKYKTETSISCHGKQKGNMPIPMRSSTLKDERERSFLKQPEKHSSKSFVFGPFTPASVPKEASPKKNVRSAQKLENLTSYRPQYRNQAISDLFSHYAAAWKSWFVEADGKKDVEEVS